MPNPTAIVTLADVYPMLGMTGAPPDGGALLQTYLDAARDIVEDIVGIVVPVTFTEYHDGGDSLICLRHTPLLSDPYTKAVDPLAITSITETVGMTNYALTLQAVGMPTSNFGYTVEDVETSQIMRRSAGSTPFPFARNRGNVQVVYTAGRTLVPANIRQGTLELIVHWWRFGHQSGGIGQGFQAFAKDLEEETGGQVQSWLVPIRVKELLQPGDRSPVVG